jgi:hypothetical protein
VNAKMSPNTEEDKREMEKCPVREGIGSLMYLANKSRPDISFAFNQISAFVSNPGYGHWEAIKRVLAFLAWTKNHGICLCGNNINSETPLIGFTDADFASDTEKRKSTTGFMFQFHGGGVSWASKRLRATAISTTDAEFYAALKEQETLYGSNPF